MASMGSVWDGNVSSEAYSYFLKAIPRNLRDDPLRFRDFSGSSKVS